MSRVVELPVVPNARHLGDLAFPQGLTGLTRVVRSGSLALLEPAGVEALKQLDIRVVIDLRTIDERNLAPEPELSDHGIACRWIPLVERDPAPFGVSVEYGHAGFLWMYQNFLEYGRTAMRRVVEALVETEGQMLYHCSAGEDRTGVVTAVLLSLVGVPDSVIVQDHSLSITAAWLAKRGLSGAAAEQRSTAPLNAMTELLQMVRARWGSVEGYLLDAGTDQETLRLAKRVALRSSNGTTMFQV